MEKNPPGIIIAMVKHLKELRCLHCQAMNSERHFCEGHPGSSIFWHRLSRPSTPPRKNAEKCQPPTVIEWTCPTDPLRSFLAGGVLLVLEQLLLPLVCLIKACFSADGASPVYLCFMKLQVMKPLLMKKTPE